MKKVKQNIAIYSDGNLEMHMPLTVQVDEAGDAWLTPDQVDQLEFMHMWVRHAGSNSLIPFTQPFQSPQPKVSDLQDSSVMQEYARTSPIYTSP